MQKIATSGSGNGAASACHGDFALRLALFYGALFLIYGVHLPYLPIWLNWRGLDPQEISVITATPFFLRVFITPTAAMAADHSKSHRLFALWLAWGGLGFALLLSQCSGFWLIFLTAIPFSICVSTIMPLTETIAVAGVRAGGLDYGRMRLWGSLTFIGANFVCGWLIDRVGAIASMWCLVAGAAATALAARFLPVRFGSGDEPRPAQKGSRTSPRVSVGEALRLVRSPLFLFFLLGAGAVQGAHAMFYTFGALSWHEQGVSTLWIGVLWGVGVGCEVALFAYSGAAVRRVGPVALLVGGCFAALLRWSAMAFNPPLALLIPLQMLHGLTYGATHLGAIHFISEAVPESAQGTAQAFYSTVAAGLIMGGATLAAGSLYDRFAGGGYLAMAALSAVGLGAAFFVMMRWDGRLLWSEEA